MVNSTSLTILQMNDSHAYFGLHQELFWQGNQPVYRLAGGYARMATLVKQVRAENPDHVLFCDCGDTLYGTHPAIATEGRAMIPILNSLGLDAMTAHWEFAYGPTIFKQRLAELDYPMLAINIFDRTTGEQTFPSYSVKEIGGLRIGLVGIASNIVGKTMPGSYGEGLEFTSGRTELPPIIERLRTLEKVDLILLISHLGFPQDMQLLAEVQGVDICLSGHTHNRIHRPVVQGRTLVIQSGCHGSFLGRLDLEIVGRQITDYRHQLMEVTEKIRPDPRVDDLVHQALVPYHAELSEVVGTTATALNRATMLETTMDNFLLQALLKTTGAQLAFSNGWRFGAPVIPGTVTVNDLYNMVPMNPPISTVELKGEEIITLLEENLERTFARDPYNQMGGYVKRGLGFNAHIKIENPLGHRVQQVFVGVERIEPGRQYSAAYITEQGVAKKYGTSHRQHTERVVDSLKAYLAGHYPLRSELRDTFVAV